MESLRGHTTGYAVPQYVIDAPGGGGKVPINPDYVLSRNADRVLIRNFEGKVFEYPEAADGTPMAAAAAGNRRAGVSVIPWRSGVRKNAALLYNISSAALLRVAATSLVDSYKSSKTAARSPQPADAGTGSPARRHLGRANPAGARPGPCAWDCQEHRSRRWKTRRECGLFPEEHCREIVSAIRIQSPVPSAGSVRLGYALLENALRYADRKPTGVRARTNECGPA